MYRTKKRVTDVQRLYAALAETDPRSTDLILVHPTPFLPAFRLQPLAQPPARQAPRHGRQAPRAPAWRQRLPKKSTVQPV